MRTFTTLIITAIVITICSCKNEIEKGRFTVTGELKNIADQKIFLEQLFFSQKAPEILDSAEIRNGNFRVSGIGKEQGLFRLRTMKAPAGFIFINDKDAINFKADLKDVSLAGPTFNTPANTLLKNFIANMQEKYSALSTSKEKLQHLKTLGNDSLTEVEGARLTQLDNGFKNFIIRFIDTSSNPVVSMFALGYIGDIDPALLVNAIPGLTRRFPNHEGVASIVMQYNQMMVQQQQKLAQKNLRPAMGNAAPDFIMNDTANQPFSLKELRGKYVLVDFWASWCGPCRRENPNVVAAYQKFKNKNFTVLGVSLDEDKSAWLQAIRKDHLEWKHISDLKGWQSAAVTLYAFDGIPYNILLDPEGKIIANELTGPALHEKLSEVLK